MTQRHHVLGLQHTRPTGKSSHCAYTQKTVRWGPMMAPHGYECLFYGVGTPDTPGWADVIPVMSEARQEELLGYDPEAPSPEFVGRSTDVGSPLYREFNARLATILHKTVQPDDVICLPWGHGHEAAVRDFMPLTVETGIGYPTCISGYRIYESYAWMHYHLGMERRGAWVSEFVCPNYFDVAVWPLRPTPPRADQYVLYFGRITKEKGINVVWQLARHRPDLTFVLCGQGDPSAWMTEPNIEYRPPAAGAERARLFHGARCTLVPTEYTGPFEGVAVESMLTGTPVLTPDFGCFAETVPLPERRCHVFSEWMAGLEATLHDEPALLRQWAMQYSMENVGVRYDRIFQQLPAIRRQGWAAGQ